MGSINFGAPKDVIERLRAAFSITAFIETGTYLGGTAAWASEHFQKVLTIEGSPEFHRQAKERHGQRGNIDFLLGDSRTALAEALSRVGNAPTAFWLDAHWMPGSFGEGNECPVLNEIRLIHQNPGDHFILIDDARLFLTPPPRPHRAADWPGIAEVLATLHPADQPPRFSVIHQDAIINVPGAARELLQNFCQDLVTAQFEADQSRRGPAPTLPGKIKRRLRRMALAVLGEE